MFNRNFNDEIIQRYIDIDPDVTCRSITFQVTNDCCLNCSYCYQTNKGHEMMTKETAKKIVDLLFKLYDEDKENSFINHHTRGIVLDFIGGEPLMNVDVIDYTMTYFIEQCVEKDHPWLTNFRASMSTNGLLYFDPHFQTFLDKFRELVSLTITVDGPRELHDACRKDYDGNGSFDRSMAAWEAWRDKVGGDAVFTKVTIAPENLAQIDKILDFFVEHGCIHISANPIYEHAWTVEEASIYYKKLVTIADKLLTKDYSRIMTSIFRNNNGYPVPSTYTTNWCGGTSAMLAFDPEGKAYPCLRYMASSLGPDIPPIIIGDVDGIYNTPETQAIYEDMKKVTRQSQSTQECIDCPVASGCAWCSAANYAMLGSYNKRSTNICWMHRAESLANVYYWNQRYRQDNSERRNPLYLPRDIATKLITNEEYDKLLILSLDGK